MKQNREHIITSVTRVYEHEDCLKSMGVVADEQGNQHASSIFSLFHQEHHCSMVLNPNNFCLEQTCTCRWFAEYKDCPHIHITKKLIREIKEPLPVSIENSHKKQVDQKIQDYHHRMEVRILRNQAESTKQVLNTFIKLYDTQMKLHLDETMYEIEPIFIGETTPWELSFKIGAHSKYVVKSLPALLQNIDEQKEIAYGKKLTFVHSIDAFSPRSQAAIAFIRKHMQKIPESSSTCKTLQLAGAALDEFYDIYKDDEDVSFACYEEEANGIVVNCTKKENYYVFHLNPSSKISFGEKHLYQCEINGSTSIITRYKLDDEGVTALFLMNLKEQDLVISEADYPKFYKYVLVNVMRYVNVNIPITVQEESMERAELYGDLDETGQIYFYMYCYGASNVRYYGFDANRIISYEQDIIESYIKKYASHMDEATHMVYMDETSDRTLDFISEGLPYLSKYCEIYVSEALKSLGKSQSYHIKVGVTFQNDLLSLNIESLEIPKEELANVLQAYKKKKKFYRLRNGKLLSLQSDDLEELHQFMEDYHLNTQQMNKGKIAMEPYRMFSLDQRAEDSALIKIERERSFTRHLDAYDQIKQFPIPAHYQSILRDYQKDGFQWLSTMRQFHFNGILADDMGLGKTVQVIALLEANASNHCSMVVCPASLIYNWDDEIQKFSDGLRALCITGSQEVRKELIQQYEQYDVLITSYDYIRRDIEQYEVITFDTVILDEAQYIKNHKTKNAMSVKQLSASHRLALTGTPIENSLAELWSIFDFLMPNYLFNYHYFQKQYETAIIKEKDEERQQALRKLVSPFILRRNKKDVLLELPDKIEKIRMIEFNEEEKKLYLANLLQVQKDVSKLANTNNSKIEILAMLTKLRQLCCEPRTVYENINSLSSKMSDCLELIEELHENHQKVLLFSSFTSMLDLLEEELRRKQISYYKLTGSTDKEKRKELVADYQKDDTCVFLISLKAGGTGLNLTAAEAVIHFDPWWNVSAQNQATDRAYRIGQNKNVQVFKMIMKDSIEEKIIKLQERKKALADAFVENNEGAISSMSKEELMELFQSE